MLPVSWQMGCDFVSGQRDVLVNDLERIGGEGIFLLALQRGENGAMHVVGNFGGGAADEFDEGILQLAHKILHSVKPEMRGVNCARRQTARRSARTAMRLSALISAKFGQK